MPQTILQFFPKKEKNETAGEAASPPQKTEVKCEEKENQACKSPSSSSAKRSREILRETKICDEQGDGGKEGEKAAKRQKCVSSNTAAAFNFAFRLSDSTLSAATAEEPLSGDFLHLSVPFLREENLRDAQGRRRGEAGYDETTLKVPKDFLDKQTPAQRQWWDIKVRKEIAHLNESRLLPFPG